jgi:predicted ferric reductase
MNKYKLESLVFLFFGLFHAHRIWAFVDSKSYNKFWLNILESRGTFFIIFGLLLLIMSIIVIIYFIKNFKYKKWWRWIYFFGGVYLIIDTILNLLNNNFIKNVVIKMYTIKQPYYSILWGLFIILGIICIILSKYLWNYTETKYEEKHGFYY